MGNRALGSLIVLFISTLSLSQNYIYKGDKQFVATPNWNFKLTNYNWNADGLSVCVGKNETGGYLMLSVEVPFDEAITGNIFFILEDGKTVTLKLRVVNDHVDKKSQVLYEITPLQFVKLKSSNIAKIRFSLKNRKNEIGGMEGNYTATNEINEYGIMDKSKKWNTAEEVAKLEDQEN